MTRHKNIGRWWDLHVVSNFRVTGECQRLIHGVETPSLEHHQRDWAVRQGIPNDELRGDIKVDTIICHRHKRLLVPPRFPSQSLTTPSGFPNVLHTLFNHSRPLPITLYTLLVALHLPRSVRPSVRPLSSLISHQVSCHPEIIRAYVEPRVKLI
jgi:hypothetical protein